MNLLNDLDIKTQGLNPRRIRIHQKRILQALHHEINTDISIQNVCSTQNGSIIPWKIALAAFPLDTSKKGTASEENWQKKHLVSCIPAAGAASRFFLELRHFVNIIDSQLEYGLSLEIPALIAQFPFLKRLVTHTTKKSEINQASILSAHSFSRILIEKYASQPKLHAPATLENDTFLKLKIEEQISLLPCLGNVLVVPNKMKKDIQNALYLLNPKAYEKWLVLEQDSKLSTIRFLRNGEPFLDEQGKYSVVSAGHGELLHLFDNIASHFSQAHCLHIRNIDNIIGSNIQRQKEVHIPLKIFHYIRDTLENIRQKIPHINLNKTFEIIDEVLYEQLIFISKFTSYNKNKLQSTTKSIKAASLYELFSHLFHWAPLPVSIDNKQIWKLILEHCERPLSVFGVVRREKGDVGGGPVFAKISDGSIVKLCMEMPHANPDDAQEYFSETGKVTHFNPALVFFEMRTHTYEQTNEGKKVNFVQLFDERFWLLSKREYKGTPVCYHETVLYELLGNSATTNLIFLEVPRSLFKPHKSYLDCLEQNRESYGFNQNFKSE